MKLTFRTVTLLLLLIICAGTLLFTAGCGTARKTTSTTDTHSDTTSVTPTPH